jgi:hypothetical protein
MTKEVTEGDVYHAAIVSAVHKQEYFVLDLGTEVEWSAGDLLMAHDVRFQLRDGHMVSFCNTCETAMKEREQ